MELLLSILASFGVLVLLWLIVDTLNDLAQLFQIWQLKRTRVHDDLNRHEEEIKTLKAKVLYEEMYARSLNDYIGRIEKKVAGLIPKDTPPGAEETPEAITITEVPPTDEKFFLDYQGDVWKQKEERNFFLWDRESMRWVITISGLANILGTFKGVEIPAEHAEALTK